MKMRMISGVVMLCIAGQAMSCSTVNLGKSGPDPAIQSQFTLAGLALLKTPGDTTKNYLKDLKGEMVPAEVRKLEKMLGGDRIRALEQLVYYIDGTKAVKSSDDREKRGWSTLAIASYF